MNEKETRAKKAKCSTKEVALLRLFFLLENSLELMLVPFSAAKSRIQLFYLEHKLESGLTCDQFN